MAATPQKNNIHDSNPGHTYYTTCSLSPDTRIAIANMFSAWRRLNKKTCEFEELLKEAGYDIPRPTLYGWSRNIETTGTLAINPGRGAHPAALDGEKGQIVLGYCFAENLAGRAVSLSSTVQFIQAKLHMSLSEATVSRFFAENEVSSKVAQMRSAGTSANFDEMARIYSSWISQQNRDGLIPSDLGLLGSIDFTYTKHSGEVIKTYSMTGRYVFLSTHKNFGIFLLHLFIHFPPTVHSH